MRLLFILSVLFIQVPSSAANLAHVKIGVAFSVENKYDRSTQQIINGIQTAKISFEKKNSAYKVDLISYDFRAHDLSSVAVIANRICKDKTPIVIGGEVSEDALMLGKILNACHVVLITPTATNPLVTENKPYVFRISSSDEEVAKKMASFAYKKFSKSNIGVIDDVSLPYPDFLTKSFVKSYSKLSSALTIKNVLRENIDYSNEIDEFIRKDVKVVIMLTYDIDLKRFFYQAAEKNYFPIYIGSDGWGSNESIVKVMKNYSPYGSKFVGYRNDYWKENSQDSFNVQFKKLYKLTYSESPNAWNAIGFDAGWLVFSAIARGANVSDAEDLRIKIAATKHLKLLTSSDFSFEKDNTPVRDLYIYKITAKGSSYVSTLKNGD